MRTYWVAPLFTVFICACLGTESGPAAKEWSGVARRSCGPADGPAVEFLIDTLPIDCASQGAGTLRFYGPGFILDSLSHETIVIREQPLTVCDGNSDPVAEDKRLELDQRDSAGITAHFRRIRTHPCTPTDTRPDTLEGVARLKVCREAPKPLCG